MRLVSCCIAAFIALSATSFSQFGLWTFHSGDRSTRMGAHYGVRGVYEAENQPGNRLGANTWTGADGTHWLFGGGVRNDLWRYDPLRDLWAWINGDATDSARLNRYIAVGVAGHRNSPGSRERSVRWVDRNGDLWMYGGLGYANTPSVRAVPLSDLWRFDVRTSLWTYYGEYHRNHVENWPDSLPGPRWGATAVHDADGVVYMFGGFARGDESNLTPVLADLWSFDTRTLTWTMLSDTSVLTDRGNYSVRGVEDDDVRPGARANSHAWLGPDSTLWLFGGFVWHERGPYGNYNDFWRFNLRTRRWTWMSGDSTATMPGARSVYGTRGVASDSSHPSARTLASTFTDERGRFYMFGGWTLDEVDSRKSPPFATYNDVWVYDPSDGRWQWLAGDSTSRPLGTYGVEGIESATMHPAARVDAATWYDQGRMWIYGGSGRTRQSHQDYTADGLNEHLRYDVATNRWTWINGFQGYWSLGARGVESEHATPGARTGSATWVGSNGDFWLFGGWGNDHVYWRHQNDMWRYSRRTKRWTYVRGDSLAASASTAGDRGNYGTRRVESDTNLPGARIGTASWVDSEGNFWMYGGHGLPGPGRFGGLGLHNDVWRFNPRTLMWTWIDGYDGIGATRGGAPGMWGPSIDPGARAGVAYWPDTAGNMWMYGGGAHEHDLWKYDPSSMYWHWIDDSVRAGSPGPRSLAAMTSDNRGALVVFGGQVPDGLSDEVWRITTSDLDWRNYAGSQQVNAAPVYGPLFDHSDDYTPGGRKLSRMWRDSAGAVHVFSGERKGRLNDHWIADVLFEGWTWIGGDTVVNARRRIVAQGVPMPGNSPGAPGNRLSMEGTWPMWIDADSIAWFWIDGAMWSFGGSYRHNAFDIGALDSHHICAGRPVTIGVDAQPGVVYAWDRDVSTSSRITVAPYESVSYVLNAVDTVRDFTAVDTIVVHVIPAPLATITTLLSHNQLTLNAPYGADSYHWQFGDGQMSRERNPVHRYDSVGTYRVSLAVNSVCGFDSSALDVTITSIRASVADERSGLMLDIRTAQSQPSLTVHYAVATTGMVRLELFDAAGRRRHLFVDGTLSPGGHILTINPRALALPSGTYLLRLTAGRASTVEKVIVVE